MLLDFVEELSMLLADRGYDADWELKSSL